MMKFKNTLSSRNIRNSNDLVKFENYKIDNNNNEINNAIIKKLRNH